MNNFKNLNLMNKSSITNQVLSNTNIKYNNKSLIYLNKLNIYDKSLNLKAYSFLNEYKALNKAYRIKKGLYVFFDTKSNSFYSLSNKKLDLSSNKIKNLIYSLLNKYTKRFKRIEYNKSLNIYSNSISIKNSKSNKTIYQRKALNHSLFYSFKTYKECINTSFDNISCLQDTKLVNFYNMIHSKNINKHIKKQQSL